MSTLRRLVIELRTGLRKIADDLENHEAVAESAIDKLAGLRARTASEAARLQRQSDVLQAQLDTLENDVELWRDRAKRTAATDESKALECVKRMTLARQQSTRLQTELERNRALASTMQTDLEAMDDKLRELRRRRAAFATREARAQVNHIDIATNDIQVEDVFDRWERQILLQESRHGSDPLQATDKLTDDFRHEEEATHLRALLQNIIDTQE